MRKYKLIAFEGIDGSGKSTQIKYLANHLKETGVSVELTCEPTNQYIGRIIRDIFNHRLNATQETIAGLFVADRLEHILNPENGMLKHLESGHVLTDRYYFSSYAYHGVHVDMDWVMQSNAMAVKNARADAHFFIDVSPELALERIQSNRTHVEMYETLDNLKRVRDKYFEAFEKMKDSENIVILDGDQNAQDLAMEVLAQFNQLS